MKFFAFAFAAALAAAVTVSAAPTGANELAAAQPRAVHIAHDAQRMVLVRSDANRRDPPKGLIQNVGQLVALIEKGLGITALENQINETLGGHLQEIEDSLGLTKAEKALGLTQGKIPDGILEKLLGLIKDIDNALGITALENFLNGLLGGTLGDLENALGVTYLLKELNLE